jgi:hypothetical protein
MSLVITIIVVVTRPHPFTAADARRAGVAVLIGDKLFLPDGTTTTLRVDQDDIFQLTEIPSGFLANVHGTQFGGDGFDDELRIIYPGGSYGTIAELASSDYYVTSDGRTVVVQPTVASGESPLRSIDLETGRQLHEFAKGSYYVASLNGDWAIVSPLGNAVHWTQSDVWNVRTGVVIPLASDQGVVAWGVTPTGAVLRAVNEDPTIRPDVPTLACLDVVTPTGSPKALAVPTKRTGVCRTFDLTYATVSPDGTWAVLVPGLVSAGHGIVAVRTADLHAGRWAPVVLDEVAGESSHLFWDSATTFVTPFVNDRGDARYARCSVDGHCHDIGVPGTAMIASVYGG